MKVIIHNRKYEDSIEICEDSLEEVRATAMYETERRGWDVAVLARDVDARLEPDRHDDLHVALR